MNAIVAVKYAIWLVAIGAAIYLVRTVGRPDPAAAITQHNQELVDLRDSIQHVADSMAQRESTFVKQAQRLAGDQRAATARLRLITAQLAQATTAHDTILVQDSMLVAGEHLLLLSEQRCQALDSAFTGCAERAQFLQVRIDTLTSALRRQIGVSTCRFAFMRCISRRQALAVGILLGGVTGFYLGRQ